MKRWVYLAVIFACSALAQAAPAPLTFENELLPSPAGLGVSAPELTSTSPDTVALSWTENAENGKLIRHNAQLRAAAGAWSEPTRLPITTSDAETRTDGFVRSTNGPHVATARLASDGKEKSLFVSSSRDGGSQFFQPVRVNETAALSPASLAVLRDGTVYLSWLSHYSGDERAVVLRRISPSGTLSAVAFVATVPNASGSPQLALLREDADGGAQLVLAYLQGSGEASQLVTRRLTLAPPAAALPQPCNCPDDFLRGYALRGRVQSIDLESNTLELEHAALPGLVPEGSTRFNIQRGLLERVGPNSELIGRVEKRDDGWWLFDVRLLVRPENRSTRAQ